MTRCVECGTENPESHRFCGGCGARLGPTAPGRCGECHNHVGVRDKYCMFCGASLPQVGGAGGGGPTVDAGPPRLDEEGAPERDTDRAPRVETEEEPRPADIPTAAMRAPVQLKIVAGRGVDKGYITPAEGGSIGRSEDADIPLENDAYVSEEHARIFRDEEGVFVEDAGSVNGTFVKVDGKARLRPGDEFKVGQSIFRLEK